MKPACWHAGALLQRRAAGLTQADGLRLEEHLAHCAACRDAASLLSGMRELHASTDATLSDSARQRVIDRALASQSPAAQHRPRRTRVLWPALAVAAVCALASVAVFRSHPLQPAGDRLLAGELVNATGAPVAQTVPSDQTLATAHGARIALAHATASLRPATRVRWNAAQRTLRLDAGSVTLDVDPSLHRSFSVSTEHFDVRVLGTVFEVAPDHVSVQRGRVRVETRDGGAPMILEAGGRSSFQLQTPPEAARADQAPAPVATPASKPNATVKAARPELDLAALLDRARSELAERHVDNARTTLREAIARKPKPPELAEALSLRAECDLVAGEYARARKAYLDVAQRFAQLPAAESALFAAARIAAEHGDPTTARALFERYLAHYPHGSFARDVERRLQAP